MSDAHARVSVKLWNILVVAGKLNSIYHSGPIFFLVPMHDAVPLSLSPARHNVIIS